MGKIREIGRLRGYVNEGDLIRLVCRGMPDMVGYYQNCIPFNIPVAVFCRSEQYYTGKMCDRFNVNLEDGLAWDCEGPYETKKYKLVKRNASGKSEIRTFVFRRRDKKVTHFEIIRKPK